MQNINWEMMTQFVFPEDLGTVEEVISVNIKPRWQQVETDESIRLVGIYHITSVVRFNPTHLPEISEGTLIEHLEFDGNDGYFEYALPLEVDLPKEKISQSVAPELFVDDVTFFVYDGASCTFKWETRCAYEQAELSVESNLAHQWQPPILSAEGTSNSVDMVNRIDEQNILENEASPLPVSDNLPEIEKHYEQVAPEHLTEVEEHYEQATPEYSTEVEEHYEQVAPEHPTEVEEHYEQAAPEYSTEVEEQRCEQVAPEYPTEAEEHYKQAAPEYSTEVEERNEQVAPEYPTEVEEHYEQAAPEYSTEVEERNEQVAPEYPTEAEEHYKQVAPEYSTEVEERNEQVAPEYPTEVEEYYDQIVPEYPNKGHDSYQDEGVKHSNFEYRVPTREDKAKIEYSEVKIDNDIVEIIEVQSDQKQIANAFNADSTFNADDFFSELSESYTLLNFTSNKIFEE